MDEDEGIVEAARSAKQLAYEQQPERSDIESRFALLTPRERQVVELIIVGTTTKAIASQFGISPRTIDVHRSHIMLKMRTKSVAQLVKVVVQFGLCDVEG